MLAAERADALCNAATFGSARVVRELCSSPRVHMYIDQGCDANATTALMSAATSGRADSVAVLLEAGADVNCCDALGRTALMFAAANGSTGLRRQQHHHLSHHRSMETVEDVEDDEQSGQATASCTPLPPPCPPRSTEAVLLAHGADVIIKASNGWNAIMFACAFGKYEAAGTILEIVESSSVEHWPRHAEDDAASSGTARDAVAADALMAVLAHVDGKGRTALDLARMQEHPEVVGLLEAVLGEAVAREAHGEAVAREAHGEAAAREAHGEAVEAAEAAREASRNGPPPPVATSPALCRQRQQDTSSEGVESIVAAARRQVNDSVSLAEANSQAAGDGRASTRRRRALMRTTDGLPAFNVQVELG